MPSPSPIPRSSSYPNISSSPSTKNHGFVRPSSSSSSRSRSSARTRSSYWPHWSNINQLGNLIIPGRKSSDSSSKHSDLTEESLEAHNRRHAPLIVVHNNRSMIFDEKNYAKCSPYYKGLTDASLAINREKVVVVESPSSPGRESHATTVGAHSTATTSTSLSSSFVLKLQEWSSCFTFNKFSNSIAGATAGKNQHGGAAASFTASSSRTAVTTTSSIHKDLTMMMSSNYKEVALNNNNNTAFVLLNNNDIIYNNSSEKPLRERVSDAAEPADSTLPLSENRNIFVESDNNKDDHHHLENKDKDDREEIAIIKEFIWASKYQPKTLEDFICNRDKAVQLQDLVTKEGGQHGNFIFEGPPGVGKRTMIRAMLREAFGPDRVQTSEERKVFDLKGEARGSIQVNIKESSQHVEVNLSDLKGYEKHVIVELMKETQSKLSSKSMNCLPDDTRAVILCEADKLSTDALLYMRWLLERYKGLNKVFFCCSDVSKLQPIKSLCTVVQLLSPSKQEIVEVLKFIAKQEGIQLPHQLAEKIADNSNNNLRQAIRSFEASWQTMNYKFVEDQVILTGWEDDITNIAKKIIQEQSPKQLYIIRGKLQNLIEHDSLVEELKKHLDVELHRQVERLYDEYSMDGGDDRFRTESEKPFVHGRTRYEEMGKRLGDPSTTRNRNVQHFLRIEEFIAKFMSWYKTTAKNYRCEPRDRPAPTEEA